MISNYAISQTKPLNKNNFSYGEKLKFRVYYHSSLTGKLTAGEAMLEIKEKPVIKNGKQSFHVIATGNSKGIVNSFYKVNDRFESFIYEEELVPWYFIRRTKEGNYVKNDEITFYHDKNIAISRSSTKKIPINVQDFVSMFYYARTFDVTGIKNGDGFPLSFIMDDSVYTTKVFFTGFETIKTSFGDINCMKFKPMVIEGNVFNNPYPMEIWISNDNNRLPILAKSALIIGSIKLELIKFEGISNALSSLTVNNK